MEAIQTKIGFIRAAEALKKGYAVGLNTANPPDIYWQLPSSLRAIGIVSQSAGIGQSVTIVYDGITEAYIDESVTSLTAGETLVAQSDGSFIKGLGNATALESSETGGKLISVMLERRDLAIDTKVDKAAGFGLSENSFTDALLIKLNQIEDEATIDQTGPEIRILLEGTDDTNIFDDDAQSKLAALTDHYKGTHPSISALQIAHPTAEAGDYADVDGGVGVSNKRYAWDVDDVGWVEQLGESDILTDSQIASQYHNNPDTERFQSAEKVKLGTISSGANVNVQGDFSESSTSSDSHILNKPRSGFVDSSVLSRPSQTTGGLINQQANVFEDYLIMVFQPNRSGAHNITSNFGWSINDNGQDFRAEIEIDGNGAFNDIVTLVRKEGKESGGNNGQFNTISGGSITGSDAVGTDQVQRASFDKTYNLLSTETYTVALRFTGSQNGVEAAIHEGSLRWKEEISE